MSNVRRDVELFYTGLQSCSEILYSLQSIEVKSNYYNVAILIYNDTIGLSLLILSNLLIYLAAMEHILYTAERLQALYYITSF